MSSALEPPTRQIEASRRKLASAFDQWQKEGGRSERGSNDEACDRFLRAIQGHLDIGRHSAPARLGLPTSRSTWSNWRSNRGKPTVRLRLDVCRAILAITGIDTSSNGFLGSAVVNGSDMVTLGPTRSISSTSEALGACHEVIIDWLDFKVSSPKEISLDQTKRRPMGSDSRIRVGSVRYALKEASILVQSPQNAEPVLTFLSSGSRSELGRIDGIELLMDSEENSRWSVQPTFPKEALQARAEGLHLCRVQTSGARVVISISKNDLEPNIAFDQGLHLDRDDFQATRERLVEQVLRNRMIDSGTINRFVISHAIAEPK